MKQFVYTLFIALLFSSCQNDEGPWQLQSPNEQARIELSQADSGRLYYSVYLRGKEEWKEMIQPSPLGIIRADGRFVDSLRCLSAAVSTNNEESYTLLSGNRQNYSNRYNELELLFENQEQQKMGLILRAYDDGVAFRYHFPGESGEEARVADELTGFRLGEGNFWGHPYDTVTKWNPAYETFFTGPVAIGTNAPWNKNGWAFPLLFETNGSWAFISESGFDGNYGGSHLHGDCENGLYRLKFAEPEEAMGHYAHTQQAALPWKTPWRFITLGNSLADIVESQMVTGLADACQLGDTGWIKPGRASWSWWSDSDSPQDYEKLLPFVDLAADMGWEYSLVDANWNHMKNGNLKQLAEYAAAKGVGLLVWYNSGGEHNTVEEEPRNLMDNREARRTEFERISRMGIKGIKVDFFQSDKQEIIQLYLDILQDAADYKLVANFHGCTLPKGWRRTYPNLLTMEAIRGGECYKFDASYPEKAPAHLATIPFTRGLAGPTDYTPGGFSNSTYPHLTTYGFELALPVVIESGIIHYVDTPEKIKSLPDFAVQWLRELPAQWEETRYIAGYPGKDAVLARRMGNKWYIGGINGEGTAKNIQLDLSSIAEKGAEFFLISDDESGKGLKSQARPWEGSEVEVKMLPFGGFAGILSPPTDEL